MSRNLGAFVQAPDGSMRYVPPPGAQAEFSGGFQEGSEAADRHITRAARPVGRAVGYGRSMAAAALLTYGAHKAARKFIPYRKATDQLYLGARAVKNWIVNKMSSSGGKMDVVTIDNKTTANPAQQVMGTHVVRNSSSGATLSPVLI